MRSLKVMSCCCYHKGTNFQANHNCGRRACFPPTLLLLPQRYEFSSKSQRSWTSTHRRGSCCCYHKGTNFQANHNFSECLQGVPMLLLLPQRYEFSSKSQHLLISNADDVCCCCYHKGTNFQANHNGTLETRQLIKLLLLPQRYEFSSKSQHDSSSGSDSNSCCCYHKGTNFQANHNRKIILFTILKLLLLPQRYEFSSKSQHSYEKF